MAQYQVLYWKHIPAQVRAFQEGKRPLSRPMPGRFQVEIDRIAMMEGLTGTDEYLNQWHWTTRLERPGTAEEVADSVIRELDAEAGLSEESAGQANT
jgi:hypothetical protein